ncbi:hypothetical protein ACWDNI_14360 [Nocardia niigatensis]
MAFTAATDQLEYLDFVETSEAYGEGVPTQCNGPLLLWSEVGMDNGCDAREPRQARVDRRNPESWSSLVFSRCSYRDLAGLDKRVLLRSMDELCGYLSWEPQVYEWRGVRAVLDHKPTVAALAGVVRH